MENVSTSENKITATAKFSTPETTSSQLPTISIKSELANLDSIHTCYKPLILTATQILKREPSFNGMSLLNRCTKRSLLPFLGDALIWLTRTAMTKDVRDIKSRVNQLTETQTHQQDTLVMSFPY